MNFKYIAVFVFMMIASFQGIVSENNSTILEEISKSDSNFTVANDADKVVTNDADKVNGKPENYEDQLNIQTSTSQTTEDEMTSTDETSTTINPFNPNLIIMNDSVRTITINEKGEQIISERPITEEEKASLQKAKDELRDRIAQLRERMANSIFEHTSRIRQITGSHVKTLGDQFAKG
ncbi:hypothetical protein ACFFRR_003594 [Megaselia abdita]